MIDIEVPYGLTAGYDARAADVAVKSRESWDAVPADGMLVGSPELVIQIKSPSNRDVQMEHEAIDHITHGAVAVCWCAPSSRRLQYLRPQASKRCGAAKYSPPTLCRRFASR